MGKQILTDIRLHPDAEGMTVISHDVLQERAQQVAAEHDDHDRKESLVHLIGQHIVQGAAGDQREHQVNGGDANGAEHIDGKEPLVVFEIGQKDHQR